MERKALYRKYRPQNFDDMYGQEVVTKTIANAIKNNSISHSYIFAGNKGSGKTSLAKIFAKAINCEQPNGYNPCNQCARCQAINANTTTDILEIDAASNNGVDDARTIIESVNYLPNEMKKKVIIIDEAHMLTTASWNALLKTVEEPPEWVVFIFATTEYHKIPPTIVSRCQRYDFHKIPLAALEKLIKQIAKNENITISDTATNNIAKLADGAARDALSILDQLASFDGNQISDESINQLFGIVNIENKINLINHIYNNEANALVSSIDAFYNSGINFSILCADLVDILMDKLIYTRTNNATNLTICNQNNINAINYTDQAQLLELVNLFNEALQKIKFASNPKLVMEIALINALKHPSNHQPVTKAQVTQTPTPTPTTGTPNIWSNQLKQQVVSSPSHVTQKTQQFSLEEIIEEQNAPKLPIDINPFTTKEIIFEEQEKVTPVEEQAQEHTPVEEKKEPYIMKAISDYDEEFKKNFFAIVHNRQKEINQSRNEIFTKLKTMAVHINKQVSKFLLADNFLLSSPNGSVILFKTKNEALRFNEGCQDDELLEFVKKYFDTYKLILGVDMETARELKVEYNKIQANEIKDVKILEKHQDTIKTKILDILNDDVDE